MYAYSFQGGKRHWKHGQREEAYRGKPRRWRASSNSIKPLEIAKLKQWI
jgi:hypothetical protein